MTLRAPAATPRTCSATAPRSESLPMTVVGASPNSSLSASMTSSPSGASTQPRLGARRTRPSDRSTMPGTPTPVPIHRDPSGRPTASDRVIDTICRTPADGLNPVRRCTCSSRARTWPPNPTTAPTIRSTRTSNAIATAAVATGATTSEGRPTLPVAPACSTTRPASANSATSTPTVLRLSPVKATRSDRLAGPPTCTRRRILARLLRRTSSCVAAESATIRESLPAGC